MAVVITILFASSQVSAQTLTEVESSAISEAQRYAAAASTPWDVNITAILKWQEQQDSHETLDKMREFQLKEVVNENERFQCGCPYKGVCPIPESALDMVIGHLKDTAYGLKNPIMGDLYGWVKIAESNLLTNPIIKELYEDRNIRHVIVETYAHWYASFIQITAFDNAAKEIQLKFANMKAMEEELQLLHSNMELIISQIEQELRDSEVQSADPSSPDPETLRLQLEEETKELEAHISVLESHYKQNVIVEYTQSTLVLVVAIIVVIIYMVIVAALWLLMAIGNSLVLVCILYVLYHIGLYLSRFKLKKMVLVLLSFIVVAAVIIKRFDTPVV